MIVTTGTRRICAGLTVLLVYIVFGIAGVGFMKANSAAGESGSIRMPGLFLALGGACTLTFARLIAEGVLDRRYGWQPAGGRDRWLSPVTWMHRVVGGFLMVVGILIVVNG